jgi:hypothetical protein
MIALEQALAIVEAQEFGRQSWNVNDDLCDCVYQRTCSWYNPYIGETYEVRICCLYAEFEKQWPHLFRRLQTEPAEWNGETDMPRSIYHRQLAALEGISLEGARSIAGEAPKGKPRSPKPLFWLPMGSEYFEVILG